MASLIENPDNTLDPLETVWAFISRDQNGKEAVVGGVLGPLGWQPFVTANEHLLHKVFIPLAKRIRPHEASTGKTVHLYRYANRTEIPW